MRNKLFLVLGLLLIFIAIPQIVNACDFRGHVFCDTNQNGVLDFGEFGLPDISIRFIVDDVFWWATDTDSGGFFVVWPQAGYTNRIEVDLSDLDLPYDSVPTTATYFEMYITAEDTNSYEINFGFFSEECLCPPLIHYPVRTMGYWKHNTCFWADPPDNNGFQEEETVLADALTQVNATWWKSAFGYDLTMESACQIFQDAQGNDVCAKAKAQLLAVMLNVARLYVTESVAIDSQDASTVGEAIDKCIWWITIGSKRGCNKAQNLAAGINEGSILLW